MMHAIRYDRVFIQLHHYTVIGGLYNDELSEVTRRAVYVKQTFTRRAYIHTN